jgi:hypothetical protein
MVFGCKGCGHVAMPELRHKAEVVSHGWSYVTRSTNSTSWLPYMTSAATLWALRGVHVRVVISVCCTCVIKWVSYTLNSKQGLQEWQHQAHAQNKWHISLTCQSGTDHNSGPTRYTKDSSNAVTTPAPHVIPHMQATAEVAHQTELCRNQSSCQNLTTARSDRSTGLQHDDSCWPTVTTS